MYTKGEWKVKPYTATVFGGQAALSCFEVWAGERRIASTINEANAHLIAAAPAMYEELKEADIIICQLCKRLNPQHAQSPLQDGCESCAEREVRLEALAQADGGK